MSPQASAGLARLIAELRDLPDGLDSYVRAGYLVADVIEALGLPASGVVPREPHWVAADHDTVCWSCGVEIPAWSAAFFDPDDRSFYGAGCGCGDAEAARAAEWRTRCAQAEEFGGT